MMKEWIDMIQEKERSELISDIIKYSALGYERFLTIADSGNVSCRFGDGILVTGSGVELGEVTENGILHLDMNGNILSNPLGLKPSKEASMHLSIYRLRPDVNSIYHVHPAYTTAYAVKGMTIPFLTSTAKRKIVKTPLVPYAEPGSEKLGDYVAEAILATGNESIKSLLLEGHGILTFADSVKLSFQLAELLEVTAKIAFLSQSIVDKS